MDYKEKYEMALEGIQEILCSGQESIKMSLLQQRLQGVFPELKQLKDEMIRNGLLANFRRFDGNYLWGTNTYVLVKDIIAWLEKQGKPKEINLVEILKHYPIETELYSPLYGKLWLAEVDEEQEIITCYKHHLEEGCTRAELEQEDTVSFYSNGTTGLPDFSVTKDCMLFLYEIKKQRKQNPNRIHITQNIIDYINKHKAKFECDIPKLGDIWNVKEIHKYPGNPIVGLENSEGAWLNLPLHVVYDNF